MPNIPTAREIGVSTESLGYWDCLAYFVTYSLGRSRHDRGLRWWYDNGMPPEDPRFALIDQVWERDGNLERYLEWVAGHPNHVPYKFRSGGNFPDRQQEEDRLSPEWEARLRSIRSNNPSLMGDSGPGHPHGLHLEYGGHL
jgi:hypothetical protein